MREDRFCLVEYLQYRLFEFEPIIIIFSDCVHVEFALSGF